MSMTFVCFGIAKLECQRNVGYNEPLKLHPLRSNSFKDLRLLIKLGKLIGNPVTERPKDLRGVLQLYVGTELVRL